LRDYNTTHMFGKGVYFARDASYSTQHRYAVPDINGEQYLLYCRVITGESTEGKQTYIRPPKKPNSNVEYECLVDSITSPSIFVAPTDNQAYACLLLLVKKRASFFFGK